MKIFGFKFGTDSTYEEELIVKLQELGKVFILLLEMMDKNFMIGTYMQLYKAIAKFFEENNEIIKKYDLLVDKNVYISEILSILRFFDNHRIQHSLNPSSDPTYDNIIFGDPKKTAGEWYILIDNQELNQINQELESVALLNLKKVFSNIDLISSIKKDSKNCYMRKTVL